MENKDNKFEHLNIKKFDNTFIDSKVEEYSKNRYKSGVIGVFDSEEDLKAAEEYDNGYEIGKDEGFRDGYIQCLKDLEIKIEE